jgi:hypothetical protein
MAIFSIFPLLAIPVIIYNLIAFLFVGQPAAGEIASVPPILARLTEPLFTVPMVSGVQWGVNAGDLILLGALALLFVEILKSTHTGSAAIMNHAVSMLLFIVCLVQFLLIPNFTTSVFFILMLMVLLDVLAGVIVTIVSARRDVAVGDGYTNNR